MTSDATRQPEFLPRGGVLVHTSAGAVQYGVPPETIKDTLESDCGVPEIFILSRAMFDLDRGLSLAELEFPINYNFFFRQRKIRAVCTRSQRERLEVILREALFGPEDLDYADEFANGEKTPGFPDLAAEMRSFRTMPIRGNTRPMVLDDVIEFMEMAHDVPVRMDGLEISLAGDGTVILTDRGVETARFPPGAHLIPRQRAKAPPDSVIVFHPPLFGITTLGAGHGFSPESMTSGMIIWVNRRGILVDPPVNSGPELARLGVPPKILDSIILTHCHADHDAGTLQKIMQEGSITLYTTPTIFKSFLKKSAALTHMPEEILSKAIRFVPVGIDQPVNINGGLFHFTYSLHAIPTISLQVEFCGKTMVYSSDTHDDPDYVNTLYEQGVVGQGRRDALNNFPWNRDIIIHEAGVPPLHTPMSRLTALPEEVRQRMYLIHVSRDMIPEGSGLKIAPTGLSATVELQVTPPEFHSSIEVLATYLDQPLFRELPPEKAMEFLGIVQIRHCRRGEAVVRQGEPGDDVFFIVTGQVSVAEDDVVFTRLGRSDFFGEKCMFGSLTRTATVTAETDVRLIVVHRENMRTFIQNTYVKPILFHLSAVRNRPLRRQLNLNPIFRSLTPSQKTELFEILTEVPEASDAGALTVITEGKTADACYFLASGEVRVTQKSRETGRLRAGALFGAWTVFDSQALSIRSYTTTGPGALLYQMSCLNFKRFVQNNPGIYMKLYAHEHDI